MQDFENVTEITRGKKVRLSKSPDLYTTGKGLVHDGGVFSKNKTTSKKVFSRVVKKENYIGALKGQKRKKN